MKQLRHTTFVFALIGLMWTAPLYGQTVLDDLLVRSQAGTMDTNLVEALQERAVQAQLSPQQTAALLMPAVLLDEQTLPSRMVLQKALEGLAKQVPYTTLKPVLDDLQRHTEAAALLADTWLRTPETHRLLHVVPPLADAQRSALIETLTLVHMQSRSDAALATLLDRLAHEVNRPSVTYTDVTAALGIWPDLLKHAGLSQTSTDVLIVALNAGFTDQELRQLPSALRTAQQRSQRSSVDVLSILMEQLGEGTSATTVLRHLRQGAF